MKENLIDRLRDFTPMRLDDYPNSCCEDAFEAAARIEQAAARIEALEARVAAADKLAAKCLELSQEAYGYDQLYETTFHRDVHETLHAALAAYEATKEQSDG